MCTRSRYWKWVDEIHFDTWNELSPRGKNTFNLKDTLYLTTREKKKNWAATNVVLYLRRELKDKWLDSTHRLDVV